MIAAAAPIDTSYEASPEGVAAAARLIARSGLTAGFGHVSVRLPDGGFAITSTAPLGTIRPEDVLVCDGDGSPAGVAEGLPLETPLHTAIYGGRADIGAIVRIHPPAVVAVGAAGVIPPLCHGLGGLSGPIALFDDPQLVTEAERAGRAVASLADADCLILRANGALASGPALADATVRAWYLEERARVHLSGSGRPLDEGELDRRSAHWPAEAERAWRWLLWRFGGEEELR